MANPHRPSLDTYFMDMAHLVASRSTCEEAHVGAILVNSSNHILATGYNGGLPGQPECSGKASCKLVRARSCGEVQEMCPTIHAEANALAQFRFNHGLPLVPPGSTIYVTTFPCLACLQQLIQAGVDKVVYGSYNSWHELGQFYADKIQFQVHLLPKPTITFPKVWHLSTLTTPTNQ